MIGHARDVAPGDTLRADVCVVGTGAAGVPLALELAASGLSVLVLEAGEDRDDAPTQALYAGTVADERLHSPPDKYRLRRFGGATVIWGGRSMPFDAIDFEPRGWIPHSGWPIQAADLQPYWAPAAEYLEIGSAEFNAERAFTPPAPPLVRGFASDRVRTDSLERFSCPTHFDARYRGRLQRAAGLRLLLGAHCTRIQLSADGARVASLEVATLAGGRFRAEAARVVLAVGGLETARLLLASNDVSPQGVGNAHDVVGRYYMCHIAGNVGTLVFNGPPADVRHGYEVSPEGVYCRRRLCLTPETQRQLGLANMVLRLHFPKITDPAHRNGVLSGLFLARRLISYEYGKRLKDADGGGLAHTLRHLWNVLTDPVDTLAFVVHWLRKRTLAERKFPSVILRNRTNRFSLEVHAEQLPRADSRVTLGTERDALGMPRLHIDWRYSPDDVTHVRRTLAVLAEELARSGVGTLTVDPTTLEADLMRFGAYGGHHVGTARMGTDPRCSVVDADCRVHGVDNLYIAGSAVFPTSSQANPTMMIVAMALRLAQHLAPATTTTTTTTTTAPRGEPP